VTGAADPTRPGFEGRRCVVTGAASGIGAATATLLRRLGAHVTGLDLREPAPGVVDRHLACDLGDPRSIAAAARAAADPGPVDALANVAGVPGSRQPAQVFAVNFLGVRELTAALLPTIARDGAIVNVASTAGAYWRDRLETIDAALATSSFAAGAAWFSRQRMDGATTYDLSKELIVVDALRAAAKLRRAHGVRLNVVSPGAVETPILPDFYATMDAAMLARMRAAVGGENGRPEQIAPVIAFLLSDAAAWVSGADVWVDGGAEAAVASGALAAGETAR
jgi:NAD(P)-dependent dehydrogenase (short-subunit alcohol dehydrogenase family)